MFRAIRISRRVFFCGSIFFPVSSLRVISPCHLSPSPPSTTSPHATKQHCSCSELLPSLPQTQRERDKHTCGTARKGWNDSSLLRLWCWWYLSCGTSVDAGKPSSTTRGSSHATQRCKASSRSCLRILVSSWGLEGASVRRGVLLVGVERGVEIVRTCYTAAVSLNYVVEFRSEYVSPAICVGIRSIIRSLGQKPRRKKKSPKSKIPFMIHFLDKSSRLLAERRL